MQEYEYLYNGKKTSLSNEGDVTCLSFNIFSKNYGTWNVIQMISVSFRDTKSNTNDIIKNKFL